MDEALYKLIKNVILYSDHKTINAELYYTILRYDNNYQSWCSMILAYLDDYFRNYIAEHILKYLNDNSIPSGKNKDNIFDYYIYGLHSEHIIIKFSITTEAKDEPYKIANIRIE